MNADDIGARIVAGRRRKELFRKGIVSAIDTTVSPWLATVNGRPMPYIQTDLAVGDVVTYVDQLDPFAWAEWEGVGGIRGNLLVARFWFGGRYTGVGGALEASYAMPATFPVQVSNLPAYVIHIAVAPTETSTLTGSLGLVPVFDNEDGISIHAGLVSAAAPIAVGSVLTSWSPSQDWAFTGLFGIRDVTGLESIEVGPLQTGTSFTFPAANVPGPDWLIVYLLASPSDPSRVPPPVTDGPHFTEDPAAPNMRKFIYSNDVTAAYQGDLGAFREWSTTTGLHPARVVTSDYAVSVRPITLVLDTRV